MANEIKIVVKGEDNASAKFKEIGASIDTMAKKAQKVGLIMAGVGVAVAAAMYKLTDSYAEAGDEVAKMAKRTGFAVETLSELRYVAQLGGTSLDSVETALKRMARTIIDADAGMETYLRSFERLNLDVQFLKSMQPEEQFWTILYAIAELPDATERAATALELFGRAGTDLLPMLADGKEAIDAQRQAAHDLNMVFDEESAAAAEKFVDAQTTIKTALQGMAAEVVDDLMPILTDFIGKMTEIIGKMTEWAAEHPELAKRILEFAALFAVGGIVITAIARVVMAIRTIITALIAMHALLGPAGWAKLAASVGIAAGAAYGFNKLMGSSGESEAIDVSTELPSYQHGGVVPGPIGKPVPVIAHGGEEFLGVGGSAGGISIQIGSFMGDESSLRAFTRKVKQIIGQDTRRTSFSGINRLEYFPGSSAP
jgi:TP901 family phage tail tape measure protein